jgi:5-methyltetrahydrofolate--homocysteine methyltransferase
MALSTVFDWDKSRERFEAWWHGEVVDRPLLQVMSPNPEAPDIPPPAYSSLEQKWLDPDYRIRMFEWQMERTYYAGDAFPYLDTHIGPGTLSLYLGAVPEFQENTVWYKKCVQDIASAQPPVFDKDNPYWQATLALCREGKKRLEGRALVSFPDLIENLDTISSLWGNDELLIALVDCPEKVHEFQRAIVPLYLEYHRQLYDIIKDEEGGSCFSAFHIYGKGRIAKVQCDFSAMISPQMFEEFVVPYLVEQCGNLDHTVYHWDGPGALQHEEALLAIGELQAIQWTPGAGNEPVGSQKWWPLYKRIREVGKSLMLAGLSPSEAQALVEYLGPEGLDLQVWVSSPQEADELVRRSFDWRKQV